jgi:predicted TIM-barrel fold metal-dependent hydrolase
MTDRYAVISADGHCGADLLDYRPYLEARYHDEFDAWAADFKVRYGDPAEQGDVAHRNWDSEVRLAETEADGVVAEVLFPNTYPPFNDLGPLSMPPPATKADYQLLWAGLRAHNRWLADFCAAAPGRRAGMALILLNDPRAAVEEVRWAHQAGLTGGVLLPGVPPGAPIPPLHAQEYDPIWEACAELGMPLNHHPDSAAPAIVLEPLHLATHIIEAEWLMHRALWHLIFSGAFERHPALTLVLTEQGADWIPGILDTLDYHWQRFQLLPGSGAGSGSGSGGGLTELSLRPSEYWARNCLVGATSIRPAEVAQRHRIGVDRIMWGQDYPHPESTFPHSTEALRHSFHGVDPGEVRQMVAGNAARVYGFDLARLQKIADWAGPTVAQVSAGLDELPRNSASPVFADADTVRVW